jgi:glycosyltransferase involved in cell wall biosynthesis
MKILHILSQAPDFTGSGKYIQAVIKCAAARGHENFLVAGIQGDFFLDPRVILPENTLFLRFDGRDLEYPIPGMSDVMPYRSKVFSSLTRNQTAAYEKAFAGIIQNACDRFRPDIVHTHHLWLASKVARTVLAGLPMVTTCHGTCLRQFALCPELGKDVGEKCRKIDRVMALGRYQKDQIQQIHAIDPKKIDIVGGGYDDALFSSPEKPFPGQVRMLYAGKLSRAKGLVWLLRSLDRIAHLPWTLDLAGGGSGPEKEESLGLARKFKGRVIVHGALSHDRLAALMGRSHIFILPSFFEGLPLVLIEALASGCRIITTSLPGTMEILGNLGGTMVEMVNLPALETIDSPYLRDMEDLEKRLARVIERLVKKVIENPRPDMEAARKITQEYTWERVFSRIEKTYENAIRDF